MKRKDVLIGGAVLGLSMILPRLPAFAQDADAAPEKANLILGEQ